MNKKEVQTQKPSVIKIIQKNKKAYFEYEIFDTYECGIILFGSEVKSIRNSQVTFTDSFARINENTLLLHNLHISAYKFDTGEELDPIRIRKLLLHKQELKKIQRDVKEKARSLIPLSLYLKNGLIKVELGVGRGKKLYDKKESIKQKDIDRDTKREIKSAFR